MIPLKDDVASRSTPIVTVLLIALNLAAYVYQVVLGLSVDPGGRSAADAFVFEFGATPCRLTGTCDRGDFPAGRAAGRDCGLAGECDHAREGHVRLHHRHL